MNTQTLKNKVKELENREWDRELIESRYLKMKESGIPGKTLNGAELLSQKQVILDRVERRAQEYNFLTGNCARGTAMALLEEFGLGNMSILTSLSAFPGFGATGWMCGGVTGALIALSLFFGSGDLLDGEAVGRSMNAARIFMDRFQTETGSPLCPDLQEKIVFGKYMDAGASLENMQKFAEAKGFEKCGALPGTGARIAAEIIIDSHLN